MIELTGFFTIIVKVFKMCFILYHIRWILFCCEARNAGKTRGGSFDEENHLKRNEIFNKKKILHNVENVFLALNINLITSKEHFGIWSSAYMLEHPFENYLQLFSSITNKLLT